VEFYFVNSVEVDGEKIPYEVFSVPLLIGNTDTPWSLAIGVPQRIINAPVLRMLRISVIISVVMLLLIAGAAFLISHSISRPL
jgi:hypothetical protein